MHLEKDLWATGEQGVRVRSRFHCAMYRVLFVSAVLAREYLEPLFLAPVQGPPGCLSRLMSLGQGEEPDEEQEEDDDLLTHEDITYLEQFPVYDLEAGPEMWEPAFGDLANWLLDDIETTFTEVRPPKYQALGMDAKELGRLQEVTFVLAAYHHIKDKLFDKYWFYPGSEEITPPPPLPSRVRKVSDVMLEIFNPEEVSMPETVEDSTDCYLLNKRFVPQEQEMPWAAEIQCVLGTVWYHSGGPTLRGGDFFPLRLPSSGLSTLSWPSSSRSGSLMTCFVKTHGIITCSSTKWAFCRTRVCFGTARSLVPYGSLFPRTRRR